MTLTYIEGKPLMVYYLLFKKAHAVCVAVLKVEIGNEQTERFLFVLSRDSECQKLDHD